MRELVHFLLAISAILVPLLGAWLFICLPDIRRHRMRSRNDRQR
jgi:hypothetical protein